MAHLKQSFAFSVNAGNSVNPTLALYVVLSLIVVTLLVAEFVNVSIKSLSSWLLTYVFPLIVRAKLGKSGNGEILENISDNNSFLHCQSCHHNILLYFICLAATS